ncbi:MAG: nickel-dependent lactate racemase [Candidatus Bathyarchaeia archaeon]
MISEFLAELPYGERKIKVRMPDKLSPFLVEPRKMEASRDPNFELRMAIDHPYGERGLGDLVESGDRVSIVVSDATRPTPSRLILPPLLDRLSKEGVKKEDIEIFIATGLHKPPTDSEILRILGEETLRKGIRVINHDAFDVKSLAYIGETSLGTPLWLNKRALEADLLISDGYVEPHFFAGYTGGGKSILPGISGLETVKVNHGADRIDHPKARAGVLKGNPIHEDIMEASEKAGLHFIINVVLDPEKRIARAFAGDFKKAHMAAIEFLEAHVKVEIPSMDLVITSNSGYPLDRNLYQAVKGMATAEEIVKPGGVIIIASECRDGVGHDGFYKLMASEPSPEKVLEKIRQPGFFMIDQWEAQVMARILLKAKVIVVSEGLAKETGEAMHITVAKSIDEAIDMALKELGRSPEVCVIPDGPYVLAKASGKLA